LSAPISIVFIVVLSLAHLFVGRLRFLDAERRSPRLSFWGGVAIAYVFAYILLISTAVRGGPPDLRTPYDDERVGREVSKQAAAEYGLVEDQELNAYVEAIGRRLARHAPGYGFDYRFAIVDDTAPNAFALPGGYIYVSRGLLALSNSEEELAGVLGHEIAHVALRHAAARQGLGSPSFLMPMKTLQILSFSRDLEHTADRVGQGLTGVAGYDPSGITEFLQSLDSLERLRLGYSRLPSFLDTHPGTTSRVSETAQRAGEIAWRPKPGVAGDRAGHLRKIEGLVVGPSGQQGLFRGARFMHPELGFTIRFPKGWDQHNTARAVGAVSRDRSGQVFLEHAGPGRDPAAAAEAWAEKGKEEGLRVDSRKSIKLVGRDAVRLEGSVRGRGGALRLHATFLPWRGSVYRIVGVSRWIRKHEPLFVNVARSFRPMTRELLADVRELRVRLIQAEPAETLAELAKRSGSDWTAMQLGVMNGIQPSHRFEGGELVKITKAESYRPESAAWAGEQP
jgi:predicted Zn-dependent protease